MFNSWGKYGGKRKTKNKEDTIMADEDTYLMDPESKMEIIDGKTYRFQKKSMYGRKCRKLHDFLGSKNGKKCFQNAKDRNHPGRTSNRRVNNRS